MAKLKPDWVVTDIPKGIKIKLWSLMIDNPTYSSWSKAIVGKSYSSDQDKLFTNGELEYIKMSRDTYKALQYEIKRMPVGEVASLPVNLQSWVKQLRPELELKVRRVPGIIPEGLLGIAVRLNDSLSRISAKDNVVWQFPDWPYLDIESTDEHPAELRCQHSIWGELKVDLKLEIEDRNKFQELLLYLEARCPEFVFRELKQRLAALIGRCQETCREIWCEAESKTGMKTVRPLCMGPVDGLHNMPEFIYNFTLDHYDNFSLDYHFEPPRLMVQTYKGNLYKITPEGKPDYKLAVGSKEAMTKCSKVIISLCQKYVQSAKIGWIRVKESEVQVQAKLIQKVLSEILDQATGYQRSP